MPINPFQRLALHVILNAAADHPDWMAAHPKQLANWCELAGMSEQRARSLKPDQARTLLNRLRKTTGADSLEVESDE